MKIRKTQSRTMPLGDAVSEAYCELQALGEELREWYDNLDGKFPGKGEQIDEAASTLENITEPDDIDGLLDKIEVTWVELLPRSKRRPLSRSDRRDNACAILDACIQALDEIENSDVASETRDMLDDLKSEAEGVEFPGMYG